MTRYGKLSEDYARLRNLAEERVKTWANSDSAACANLHHQMQELKIHLAEQEIRHDELTRAMEARHEKDEIRYESVRNMFWPLN
jgi:hypothetical protein